MPNAVPMPAKTREVFAYLKQCAREMRTATYKEIGDAVGLMPMGLSGQLDYISAQVCSAKGLPCLAALAVNANTRMPGDGWLPGKAIIDSSHRPLFWRGIVSQVYATDWSTVAI